VTISHVYPLNDLCPHSVEDGGQCECDPKVEFLESGDTLVVHNSFDGREIIEELERPAGREGGSNHG
jgi:hypothetical protein